MKKITREVQYRVNMDSFEKRRRYLEKVIGNLNNELLEKDLRPSERAKLYNCLISAIKNINDSQKDAILQDLDARLQKVESKGR